jgi:hypothetical protein
VWIPVALGLVAMTGSLACGPTTRCLGAKTDESYDRCVESETSADESERAAKREAERRRQEYRAAIEPCTKGDPLACLTVAVYEGEHDGDPPNVLAAYRVACGGSLAGACVLGGAYAGEHDATDAALEMYLRACELDDARGCAGAATLDRARAMELETRACELRDYAACNRVGLGHLAARRRAEAERFLSLACKNGERQACHQLGRLDIEEAP